MEAISRVDKKLAHYIEQQFKPVIFVINKWDQSSRSSTDRTLGALPREHFPTIGYAPIAFITGQTGKNVKALLNHGQMLYKQASTRVPNQCINRLIKAALRQQQPAMTSGKRPKIYFASQISTNPPTICNDVQQPARFFGAVSTLLAGVCFAITYPSVKFRSSSTCRSAIAILGSVQPNKPKAYPVPRYLDEEDAYIDLPVKTMMTTMSSLKKNRRGWLFVFGFITNFSEWPRPNVEQLSSAAQGR